MLLDNLLSLIKIYKKNKMIGINSVTIIGNIGTISDVLTTSNGGKFVNLTIATTETFFSASKEKKTNTQWHNVVLWNNLAELNKIISKGDLIYVEGRLNYRKKSPTQIFTEIVAKNIRVLNRKNYVKDDEINFIDNSETYFEEI
jgi:single-strand DNA-binding protein